MQGAAATSAYFKHHAGLSNAALGSYRSTDAAGLIAISNLYELLLPWLFVLQVGVLQFSNDVHVQIPLGDHDEDTFVKSINDMVWPSLT